MKDTWFDNLTLVIEPTKGVRRVPQDSMEGAKNKIKLELSGRYLVRASEEELSASNEKKRDTLIDLNSQKQEALTAYLNGVSVVEKIDRKVFSIEGKGDLFGKYFTHFEYEITTNL